MPKWLSGGNGGNVESQKMLPSKVQAPSCLGPVALLKPPMGHSIPAFGQGEG
jgi:hypothetical protein